MAQTRNVANAVPDSFRLGVIGDFGLENAGFKDLGVVGAVARVGTAACGNDNTMQCICTGDVVEIGGNVYCGDLLAGTDNGATAGVITCNYRLYFFRRINPWKFGIKMFVIHKVIQYL